MPTTLRTIKKFYPNVTAVADADQNIDIEVTDRDQKIATKKAHRECAMAVACKRATDADAAVIAVSTAYLVKGKYAVRYRLRGRVSREIVKFDRGGEFSTGVYTLHVPHPSQRLGARAKRNWGGDTQGGTHAAKSKRRAMRHITGVRMVLNQVK